MQCEQLEPRDLLSVFPAGIPLPLSPGPAMAPMAHTAAAPWYTALKPAAFGTGSPYITADTKPLAESPGNTQGGTVPPPSALVFYLLDPYVGLEQLGGAVTVPVDGMTAFAAHQVTITDSLGNIVWQASFDGTQALYLAVDNGIFGTGLGQFSIFVSELDAQGNVLWAHLNATVFLGQFNGAIPS